MSEAETFAGKVVASAAKPFAWRIVNNACGQPPPHVSLANLDLEFGKTSIPITAISAIAPREPMDWDVAGQFFNFVIYMILAGFFCYVVFGLGWRWQFLFGTALFAGVSLMALADVITTRKVGFYQLVMKTAGGKELAYTTSSEQDRDLLASELRQRMRRLA